MEGLSLFRFSEVLLEIEAYCLWSIMAIISGDLLIGELIFILFYFYIIFNFVKVKVLKYLQKIEVY